MKRLSQNIFSLFFADIARRVLGFISVAYLARVLGIEGFGSINLGFAVLAYGMVLSTAGFVTLGIKKIARGEPVEIVGQIIGGRMVTTLFVFAAIVIIVMASIHDSATAWLIVLFSFTLIPQIFFVDWYFQGKEKMGVVSVARVLSAILYLIVIVLFVRTPSHAIWVAVGTFIGDCTVAVWLFVMFRKSNPGFHLRITLSLQLLKKSLPLAIGVILATITINFPPLALAIIHTRTEVGIYSAASKLVFFLLVGDRILSSLLLPASARRQVESIEAYKKMLQEALYWTLLLCLPIAAGGTILAKNLIVLVFGIEYQSSAVVFCVFIWYFFFTILHTVYTSGLIGAGREKSYGKIMTITAIAYVVCVTLGSLWMGAVGAAFGVVIAEGISVVLMQRSLALVMLLEPPRAVVQIFLSTLFMITCIFFYREGSLWSIIFTGAMSYCLFIVVFRAVNNKEVRSLMARF